MKLTKMRLALTGLVAVMLLSACNLPVTPTPFPTAAPSEAPTSEPSTPEPGAIGAACVVGTWQVVDLQSYIQDMLPVMVEGAELQVKDVSGNLTYTFNADGSSVGRADAFTLNVGVDVNGLSLPGKVVVNGSSQGQYEVDGDQNLLTMRGLSAGDLTVSANVAGVPVVNQTPVLNLLSFNGGTEGEAAVNFQCIGDALQVTVNLQNLGERVVTLERVR